MSKQFNSPLEALRYHVSGAIARGEGKPITEISPKDRHLQDARIQAAALRHYATMCRSKLHGMSRDTENEIIAYEQLEGFGLRADKLANTYEDLMIKLA